MWRDVLDARQGRNDVMHMPLALTMQLEYEQNGETKTHKSIEQNFNL